jgi:hypothetical protein
LRICKAHYFASIKFFVNLVTGDDPKKGRTLNITATKLSPKTL